MTRGLIRVIVSPSGELGAPGQALVPQLRPRQRPPDTVRFADPDVRAAVEKAKPSAPLIGLTCGNRPVAVDLDRESPHVLLSAGTGGGKSSTIRALAAQLMHHGATTWVLDAKRHSHAWLRDVPGVQ
jgi:DNA helicase HerA-like ATPase